VCVRVCVCVCVRERESKRERARERVCECVSEFVCVHLQVRDVYEKDKHTRAKKHILSLKITSIHTTN